MPSSWDQIHAAVQQAVTIASGLPAARVVWQYQNANAPPLTYIALAFKYARTKGQDSIINSTDLTRPAGQEIKQAVIGVREVSLQIKGAASGVVGDVSALAVVELARTALLLPSVRAKLATVELSPFDPGPTNHIPEVVGTTYRDVAVCEVRCYVPAPTAAEFVGYIATFGGTLTLRDALNDVIVLPYSAPT